MIFGREVNRLRNETVLTLQSTDGWPNSALSSGQSVSRESAMRLSAHTSALAVCCPIRWARCPSTYSVIQVQGMSR